MKNNNKKILIVEDDKFLAKMLSRMLTDSSYEVFLASSGQEAIDKVESGNVLDLIILDIMLPDLDGFEVLKEIRENNKTKKVPVIIMSNLGQPEDIKHGKDLGASDHLIKSDFSLDEVAKKIKFFLKK